MFKYLVSLIVFLSMATIALAQDAVPTPAPSPDSFFSLEALKAFIGTLMDGTFMAKLVGFVLGVQAILYGLAEGLTRISDALGGRGSKWAKYASDAAWYLGVFLGKAGLGEAKAITVEKVRKMVADGQLKPEDVFPPQAG